ncbi:MAG: 2-hydroxyacyl-CoA dehydratase family protein [Planctomycetota bacterium]|jgi:hypothetical protein
MKIGIVGYPPEEVLSGYRSAGAELVDLDVPRPEAPIRLADPHMPRVFCATLRTVLANALTLPLDLIVAGVGECKCDGMRFLVEILRDLGLGPVRETRNHATEGRGTPIADGAGPLRDRVDRIMERIVTGGALEPPRPEPDPPAAFWGVPPRDASLLDLFPESTQILGWTRCVENGTPADLEVESFVPAGVPTVFFAQAFCQKNVLAQYLARKHNGLYVEADEKTTRAVRAKVEAFLALNVKEGKR